MISMLHSISYAGLWGQSFLSVEDFIRKASSLGYESVELTGKRPHLSVVDTTDEDLERIKEVAEENNIKIGTVAAYNDFTINTGRGTPLDEMQAAYIKRLSQMGEKLEAENIRIFTGYSTGEDTYIDDWNLCVRAVREVCSISHSYGIKTGIQNHHDTAVTAEAFCRFIDEVGHPNCYAMFDPWSPAIHGDDLYEAALFMAPRMIQTTLADYEEIRRFIYMPELVNYKKAPSMNGACALGEGFVDFESFFRGLYEGGFKGYVAYEMCSPLRGGSSMQNLDDTARISLVRMKEFMKAPAL